MENLIDRFHSATVVDGGYDLELNRHQHLRKAAEHADGKGFVLEFGVHKGQTINTLLECFPENAIYGFDSFEGLPEDWNISTNPKFNKHKKGYFACEMPVFESQRVHLVKGFFEHSLQPWLDRMVKEPVKFLHVDSDLYSSAITVLTTLNERIIPGTVIVFDEMYPWGRKRYETWAEHEYKALQEWTEQYNREWEVLYRNNHQQCSIKVTK